MRRLGIGVIAPPAFMAPGTHNLPLCLQLGQEMALPDQLC